VSLDDSTTPEHDRSVHAKPHRFVAVFDGAELQAYRRCVYALIDPRKAEHVAYVGKTKQHPLVRLEGHLTDAKCGRHATPCCNWVVDLLNHGTSPTIAVLQVVTPEEDLEGLEQAWIRHYRLLGQAELNRNIRFRAMLEAECAAGTTHA
jgi:hypothetical protein